MLLSRDIARMLDPVLMARDCGIEPDGWQADLLRSTAPRALLLCSRQSGKTTTTSLIALHCAVFTPNALVVVVSPSQRQSAEMLRTIKGLLAKLDGAPESSDSVLKLEMANGSRVLALPGTEKTIRGLAGAALVIIDEAARVDDELLAAVRPMLATNAAGRLIALTTPAGKRGFFYEAWHDTAEGNNWHRVRVSARQCPRISQAFLDEELRALGPTRFSEEYEPLAFVDSEESAFSTAIIDAAFTSEFKALWT